MTTPLTAPRTLWRVAALVAALTACSSPGSTAQAPAGSPPDASAGTVPVTRQDLTSVVVESGAVQAYPVYLVTAPAAGAVRVEVEPGDPVRKGQVVATADGRKVTAGSAGTVVAVLAPSRTSTLPINAPLLTVRHAGFGIPVSISPDNLYRVYRAPVAALASLVSGPSGVPCRPAPAAAGVDPTAGTDPASTEGAGTEGAGTEAAAPTSATLQVVCLLGTDVQTFAGQPAKVGVRFATVSDALTLPVGTVAGSAQTGTVTVVAADGARSRRQVKLGVSDGVVVQITDGLAAGDRVSAQPPDFVGP